MSPSRKRRRSQRGQSSKRLAAHLVRGEQVVIITGAGLSVSSGVRPFRGSSGLWEEVIWKTATRASFRKNPLEWYNEFWLPHFGTTTKTYEPNQGHAALQKLQEMFPDSCHVITQNVDGLQKGIVVEAHGRLGLYKCIPEEDSDTDSDSDEDDHRLVHLGHRRKSRALRKAIQNLDVTDENRPEKNASRSLCRYQLIDSIPLDAIEPPSVRQALVNGATTLDSPPLCPSCRSPVPPQALLFDEGYHSHDFYRFEEMETLLANAAVLVFVGTSFNVTITGVALDHAREHGLPVFNFNTADVLEPSVRLNVENIVGKSDETLPRLVEDVQEELQFLAGASTETVL
ncbi:Sir2 family [Fragilaria crotonensis]|nr:Sir2 family [Fragilaria crotonensis]